MKQVVNGIIYDTDNAEEIASQSHHHDLSDASWTLYRTKGGAFFEFVVDHDGVFDKIVPLTPMRARQWLERNANHLVENYFGSLPEPAAIEFSRRTVIAAIDVLQRFLNHGTASSLFIELGPEVYKTISGENIALTKRMNDLKIFVDDHPHHMIDGVPIQSILVEKAIKSFPLEDNDSLFPRSLWPEQETLSRSLIRDGFVIENQELRRALPESLRLPEANDEIGVLLNKHRLVIAQGHLKQAFQNHTDGEWSSANGQIRSFLENLLDEIPVRLDTSAQDIPTGIRRRQRLAEIGFLSRELNEWDDKGTGYINGLFRRLHPQGAHPGLSDEEDSTFRLHTVLIAARLLLRRLDRQ